MGFDPNMSSDLYQRMCARTRLEVLKRDGFTLLATREHFSIENWHNEFKKWRERWEVLKGDFERLGIEPP